MQKKLKFRHKLYQYHALTFEEKCVLCKHKSIIELAHLFDCDIFDVVKWIMQNKDAIKVTKK